MRKGHNHIFTFFLLKQRQARLCYTHRVDFGACWTDLFCCSWEKWIILTLIQPTQENTGSFPAYVYHLPPSEIDDKMMRLQRPPVAEPAGFKLLRFCFVDSGYLFSGSRPASQSSQSKESPTSGDALRLPEQLC